MSNVLHIIVLKSIQNYDPGNAPALGAAVTVNWTDGQTYNGVFEGTNHRIMFTVSN